MQCFQRWPPIRKFSTGLAWLHSASGVEYISRSSQDFTMTESAPVLRREVDLSSDSQLKTLNQTKSLTDSELADYRTRSETSRSRFKIPNLSRQPLPGESDSRANLAE